MKGKGLQWAGVACALLLAIPLSAANGPAASTNKHTARTADMRRAWPPETLSGKITMVDPDDGLVLVKARDGIPFQMVVTSTTRIRSGKQAITLKDLARDVNKTVSVKFTSGRRGDVASSIRVNG